MPLNASKSEKLTYKIFIYFFLLYIQLCLRLSSFLSVHFCFVLHVAAQMSTMSGCRASRCECSDGGNHLVGLSRDCPDLCDERARIRGRKMENVPVRREQEVGKCVLLKMIGKLTGNNRNLASSRYKR